MLSVNEIYLGDCLNVMKEFDDASIDMVLCDLPYGVTARNDWDKVIPLSDLWAQYERVITKTGVIALTATEPFSAELVVSNRRLFRYDLIWEKPLATGFLNANRMPLRNHEQVLIFYKGLGIYNPQKTPGKPYKMTRRWASTNYNHAMGTTDNKDGLRYPMSVLKFAWDKEKLHPTQKPLALFEWLILTYTNPDMLVLDNCIGSGTTAVACKKLGRRYIGIEKEEKYWEIAQQRVNAVVENA